MPRPLSDQDIQDFRDQLCRVAERLFIERGYDGVTMRALAGELGCSAMTPYGYFENKDAILAAVREQAFVRHGIRCEKVVSEHRDPVDRFRALAHAYVTFARDEPHAYAIMFSLGRNSDLASQIADPDKRDDLVRGWRPLVDVLTEMVETGLAFGDPLDLAHLSWVTLHGLVSLELSDKLLLGRTLDDLLEPALDVFLRGIGAPPTSSEAGDPDDRPDPPAAAD